MIVGKVYFSCSLLSRVIHTLTRRIHASLKCSNTRYSNRRIFVIDDVYYVDESPQPYLDQLTIGQSPLALSLVYYNHTCFEEKQRNILWYYVPPNALIVVRPLLFNAGLLMLLFCNSY